MRVVDVIQKFNRLVENNVKQDENCQLDMLNKMLRENHFIKK